MRDGPREAPHRFHGLMSTELAELGVAALADSLRRGNVTSTAVVQVLLTRVQAFSHLNAFTTLDPFVVLEAARTADRQRGSGAPSGPLLGVPIMFKDNIDVAGTPTSAGTPALRAHRPSRHAPVAAALLGAGAIAFGKNSMHELAFGITNNNAAFGPVRNPYGHDMIPGGSSGGTAAAVGARLAPAGIGTDTGGSVRIPSALCGVAGLRPTLGRWPRRGIVPISAHRDTAGPIARCVADLALINAVVLGDPAPAGARSLDGLRVGVSREYFWEDLDPETARLCADALARLADAGVELVEANFADVASLAAAVSFVVALHEPPGEIDRYLELGGSPLRFGDVVAQVASPDVRHILNAMLDPATAVPEGAYRTAIEQHRPRLRAAYARYFSTHGIETIVFPTTPLPARPIGEDETVSLNGRRVPTFTTFARNTDPGSNAGVPGLSLPVGLTSAGLPVGLAFESPEGRDRELLAIGLAVEALFPPLPPPLNEPNG